MAEVTDHVRYVLGSSGPDYPDWETVQKAIEPLGLTVFCMASGLAKPEPGDGACPTCWDGPE